uniref:Homing endonuclease n=1 Tax=viral metagenome TaxID=1070528 RepID=A0A6M3IN33_9ZZZZ
MDNETISRERLAWLAGVIDSEGSLEVGWTNQYNKKKETINSKMMYCRIKVGNTDPRMIAEISSVFKLISVGFSFRTTKRIDREHWMLEIKTQGKGNCRKVLVSIYPYLKNKIDQAAKFLEIIQYRESVGYGGFRAVYSEDYKPLESNEILQRLIQELKDIKHNPPDPQRLTRVANRILVVD